MYNPYMYEDERVTYPRVDVYKRQAQLLSNMGNMLKGIVTSIDEVFIWLNIDYRVENIVQIDNIVNITNRRKEETKRI